MSYTVLWEGDQGHIRIAETRGDECLWCGDSLARGSPRVLIRHAKDEWPEPNRVACCLLCIKTLLEETTAAKCTSTELLLDEDGRMVAEIAPEDDADVNCLACGKNVGVDSSGVALINLPPPTRTSLHMRVDCHHECWCSIADTIEERLWSQGAEIII